MDQRLRVLEQRVVLLAVPVHSRSNVVVVALLIRQAHETGPHVLSQAGERFRDVQIPEGRPNTVQLGVDEVVDRVWAAAREVGVELEIERTPDSARLCSPVGQQVLILDEDALMPSKDLFVEQRDVTQPASSPVSRDLRSASVWFLV